MTNEYHLEKVKNRIKKPIQDFFISHIRGNEEFHMSDLVEFVSEVIQVAPNSPARIMQQMKKNGELDYELLSRSKSHYRAISVKVDE